MRTITALALLLLTAATADAFNLVLDTKLDVAGGTRPVVLGPSSDNRGHVVKVTPVKGDFYGPIPAFVDAEFYGTRWYDVARIGPTEVPWDEDHVAIPIETNVRVYGIRRPVLLDVDAVLMPGVSHSFTLGPASANRGYVVEVSPVTPTQNGARVIAGVYAQFTGTDWNDLVGVRLDGAYASVNANVRVYDIGRAPVLADFNAELQAGVERVFRLGPTSRDHGMVVEVTPLSADGAPGAHVRATAGPYTGWPSSWDDAVSVVASTSLSANIRVYAAVVMPDRFVNPAATCSPDVVAGKPEHVTIQDALDAATAEDEIGVCAGTYVENVRVPTARLTLGGVGRALLSPATAGPCLTIAADQTRVHHLEIAGCDVGVDVAAASAAIENNVFHDNDVGVSLSGPHHVVRNNLVRDSTDTGISVAGAATDASITNNTVRNNARSGIAVTEAGNVTVSRNQVQQNGQGIAVDSSAACVVSFNSATFNGHGIVLTNIDRCQITRNSASRSTFSPDCTWDGLGANTFGANTCRSETPPRAWD